VIEVDIRLLCHGSDRLADVPIAERRALAHLSVETFQDLSRPSDGVRGSYEPNLVAAGADVDAELVLEDAESPVVLAEER